MQTQWIARCVSISLVVGFVALFVWSLIVISVEDRGMAIRRLDTETARLASTLFFAKMTAIAQLSVGLLGAAWAFLTLAETKVEVKARETAVCFAVANLSFTLSLIVYVVGHDFIVTRIFHHATFDIDAPFVAKVSLVQQLAFLWGCVALGSTIFLGRQP